MLKYYSADLELRYYSVFFPSNVDERRDLIERINKTNDKETQKYIKKY